MSNQLNICNNDVLRLLNELFIGTYTQFRPLDDVLVCFSKKSTLIILINIFFQAQMQRKGKGKHNAPWKRAVRYDMIFLDIWDSSITGQRKRQNMWRLGMGSGKNMQWIMLKSLPARSTTTDQKHALWTDVWQSRRLCPDIYDLSTKFRQKKSGTRFFSVEQLVLTEENDRMSLASQKQKRGKRWYLCFCKMMI